MMIIIVNGIVTRSLRKNLEAVPGKHSIDSLQKTVILGTSHIIRKVLQCEACSLNGGDHRWFKRSTRKKRPVTREIIIIIIICWYSILYSKWLIKWHSEVWHTLQNILCRYQYFKHTWCFHLFRVAQEESLVNFNLLAEGYSAYFMWN
jgi:hypothetical protein